MHGLELQILLLSLPQPPPGPVPLPAARPSAQQDPTAPRGMWAPTEQSPGLLTPPPVQPLSVSLPPASASRSQGRPRLPETSEQRVPRAATRSEVGRFGGRMLWWVPWVPPWRPDPGMKASPTSRPQGKAPQLIRRLPVTSTVLNLIKVASV